MPGPLASRRGLLAMAGGSLVLAATARAQPVTAPWGGLPRQGDGAYEPPTSLGGAIDLYQRMTAPVMLNGAGPFAFVVDTGANQTVLSSELADHLGLRRGEACPLHSAAGVRMADTAVLDALAVGRRVHHQVKVSILPQEALGGAGLLGVDRMDGQCLTLNFKAQRIDIEDSRGARRSGLDIVAPAMRRSGQLTLVKATLGRQPVTAFVDSGAQTTIGNMRLRSMVAAAYPKVAWESATIISATGQELAGDRAMLPSFRFGGMTVHDLVTIFADLHTFAIWDMLDEPALVLGVDVLAQFEAVALDFGRSEVRFRPPQPGTRPQIL